MKVIPLKRSLLTSVALFLLLGVTCLMAQNVGSLQGTITDPAGAGAAGATVTLTDLDNGAVHTTKSEADGTYGFVQLNPGIYKLEVSKSGFKTHVEERVTILVATPTRLDLKLELGQVTEKVMVEAAEVPTLNTQDATVGNAIEENQVKTLPFLARNVVNLLTLQPGVVFTGQSDTDKLSMGSIATLDPREGVVDGVRGNQSNITVDGVDANDWQNQAAFTSVLPVTLDSVQEFRVTTTNANATNGIVSGAQVDLVTKSGSNAWHGNARWYYRTSGSAANDFFANANNIPRGKDQRNIGGGSLGGPILKDRMFFFVDNEERRESVSIPLTAPRQVPSDALRDGVLVYNCQGSAGCPTSPTTVMGLNQTITVPAGAFGLSPAQFQASDPAGLGINMAMINYMKLLPEGNSASGAFDGGFSFDALSFNTSEATKNNTYISRIDYLLTKNGRHSIFWRGSMQGLKTDILQAQFPGQAPASQLLNNSRGFAVQYQGQFSSTLTNTARYGLTRAGVNQSGTSGPQFDVRSFTDILDFGARQESRILPVHDINDDLSWTHGRHTMQFGGALYLIHNRNTNEVNSFPGFVVNNGFCIQLCAQYDLSATGGNAPTPTDPTSFIRAYMMLTGSITQVNATVFATPSGSFLPPGTPEKRDFEMRLYEGYAQDSWKVLSNVTLTFGLHYGYQTPPWEVNGFEVAPTTDIGQWFRQREINMNNGIPSTASPLLSWGLAGKANGAYSWYRPDYKEFAPRLAAAWSPNFQEGLLHSMFGAAGMSSLRVGGGIYYDRIGQALAIDSDQNGSPGTATGLIDNSQQFSLATAPRFSGTCSNAGCTGLPAAGAPFFPLPTKATFPFTPSSTASNLGFAVDPGLRTPYVIHLTASYQRQLPKGVVMDVAYVGTLGRRLLGKTDFAQYEDLRDTKSGMDLFTAFRQIAQIAAVTPTSNGAAIAPRVPLVETVGGNSKTFLEPNLTGLKTINQSISWVNDLLPNIAALDAATLCKSSDPQVAACKAGYMSLTPTQALYAFSVVNAGAEGSPIGAGAASWSCAMFALDADPSPGGLPTPWNSTLDPNNSGFVLFPPQFAQMGVWTNWANSNYHSLQVSVRKNAGLGTFAFNYVYSKSIDNDSSAENGDLLSPSVSNGTVQGLIQNPFDLRLNRADSDFDLRHNFNGYAIFDLPFGKGRRWGNSFNRLIDAAIGGWEVTGAGRWRSGFPRSPSNGFNFPTNFFLTSAGTLTAPLQTSVTRSESANGATDPSQVGTPNLFSNAAAALNDITFTLPGLPGSRNVLRSPAYASLDAGVYKTFRIWGETKRLQLRATAFNVLNSVNFRTGGISLDPTSPATFGQITATALGRGREMEFAARFEF